MKNKKYKALKSIKQEYTPNEDLKEIMNIFTKMVNYCIKVGLKENTHNMKRLSYLCYHELRHYDILGSYKINAISRAAGILSNRKQSIKRGVKVKDPFVKKPFITNCYGIKHNGCLMTVPYKNRNPINVLLAEYTQKILSNDTIKVQSFSMNNKSISFCISKQVEEIECIDIVGIDRNLRNVTCGNEKKVVFYKTKKILSIKKNTIQARSGFRRNDRRVKGDFWEEKNKRMYNRTNQSTHRISNHIVKEAVKNKTIIVLEDLRGIKKRYTKENTKGKKWKNITKDKKKNNYENNNTKNKNKKSKGNEKYKNTGKKYRSKMNGWQQYEFQRQVEYKAKWYGIPVYNVDPKNTSTDCPKCGKKLQEDKVQYSRKKSCDNCGLFMDRDVVAPINIKNKLSPRFMDSKGDISEAKFDTFESTMLEPSRTVIQIVDMSKSTLAV